MTFCQKWKVTFCLFNLKNFRRRKKANFSQKWPEDFEHHYEGWKEIDEYYVISKILKNLSGKFWEMIQKIYCSFILINTCSFDENTTSMDSSPITLQGYHRKTQKSRFQLKIYRIISLMHTFFNSRYIALYLWCTPLQNATKTHI